MKKRTKFVVEITRPFVAIVRRSRLRIPTEENKLSTSIFNDIFNAATVTTMAMASAMAMAMGGNGTIVNVSVSVNVKPENDDNVADAKHINLIVKSQQVADIHVKLKKNATFKQLFNTYCQRNNLDHLDVRFLYDGRRIRPENTPLSLDMEEGDIVEVFSEQKSGGGGGERGGSSGSSMRGSQVFEEGLILPGEAVTRPGLRDCTKTEGGAYSSEKRRSGKV